MENPKDEHAELVKIFDSEQESEALVVHGLLESAGIQSQMTSLNLQQDVYPGLSGVILRVPASQAEDLRNAEKLARAEHRGLWVQSTIPEGVGNNGRKATW